MVVGDVLKLERDDYVTVSVWVSGEYIHIHVTVHSQG